MSNFDEVKRAKELIVDWKNNHRFTTRKIGFVGIGSVINDENSTDTEKILKVEIGITDRRMELPPKFAPAISKLLVEAGLDVQVGYRHFTIPKAQ